MKNKELVEIFIVANLVYFKINQSCQISNKTSPLESVSQNLLFTFVNLNSGSTLKRGYLETFVILMLLRKGFTTAA